ncbi:choice-of-anchor B family protein [Polaribacter sp. PL03]|uniref:choice-of-anchor B family protein n=1 Tax=Polaribacter sp. PL03 TaxID=3088353 RepID=UPI0029CED0E8|nr:choice-of-anchor B family protein [Polaribacter sp. PL03]MDX6745480.1 choice-of-anchor B family protein [Polaribacter sp. PL03]
MIKKSLFIFVLIIASCSKKEVFVPEKQIIINPIANCEDGFAGEYPCNDYDLLTYVSLEDIGGVNTTITNCWGWSDPETNKEFALIGTNKGTTFIEITDPTTPIVLGSLNTKGNTIRDIKRYNSYALIINNDEVNGLQIFNLKALREVNETPVEFVSDTETRFKGSSKSIAINEQSMFAYILGATKNGGGPFFYDIEKTHEARLKGSYEEGAYANQAKVITYNGLDADYIGKEIFVGSNNNEIVLLDVSDKENPIKIATVTYSNINKTTKGAFTDDSNYFIVGDENDAENKTIVFDFSDLDNPVYLFDFNGTTNAIDNNGFVKGNIYYQTNSTAGIRMLDISNIENNIIKEVGFFDTHPENDNPEAKGTSGIYPYLSSGNILITDTERGFFVIRKKNS